MDSEDYKNEIIMLPVINHRCFMIDIRRYGMEEILDTDEMFKEILVIYFTVGSPLKIKEPEAIEAVLGFLDAYYDVETPEEEAQIFN